MPADRAQANQGVRKVPKPIPAFLRDTPARKLGRALLRMASRQNRVRGQLYHSNNNNKNNKNINPEDLIAYHDGSVIKDQSRWGFTVKRCATTIHEDSLYTVSTSSLTMEVEAVTHALRWIASRGDSQTVHVIILTDQMSLLQKAKSGMRNQDCNISMVDIHLRKFLCVYTTLDMLE